MTIETRFHQYIVITAAPIIVVITKIIDKALSSTPIGTLPYGDLIIFFFGALGGVLNYFNKQREVIVLLVILYKTQ
jgi:hypothetical protein